MMNASDKVVQVGAASDRGLDRWLLPSVLVLIGSALAGWMWWLFG